MRVHLISLIRNELDILPMFLGHVGALFESGDFVDHLSSDGSDTVLREFCAQEPGWSFGRLESEAFLQAPVSNTLMRKAFDRGADAVMFLDADEVVNELTCEQLADALETLNERRTVGAFFWLNCMPGNFSEPFTLQYPAWIGGRSKHKKLLIPRWVFDVYHGSAYVKRGNHSIFIRSDVRLPTDEIGQILHFPIRSKRQLIQKVSASFLSQQTDGNIAPHIQYMNEIITSGGADDSLIAEFAMNYGSTTRNINAATVMESAGRGAELRIPAVAFSEKHAKIAILAAGTINEAALMEPKTGGKDPILVMHDGTYRLDPLLGLTR